MRAPQYITSRIGRQVAKSLSTHWVSEWSPPSCSSFELVRRQAEQYEADGDLPGAARIHVANRIAGCLAGSLIQSHVNSHRSSSLSVTPAARR